MLCRLPDWITETIIVDGLSTDDTVDVVRYHRPDAKIVMQTVRGKGAALRAGLEAATGDVVVMLDADGSTNPDEIPRFVEALAHGADFAKGSRFLPGGGSDDMPRLRRVGNAALVRLTNVLFGTRYTDITYGYNAVWRDKSGALALEIDGWAMEIVGSIRAARNGLRVVEVPSFEVARVAGEAKLQTFSAGWTILKAILRERTVPATGQGATKPARRPPVSVLVYGTGRSDPWLERLAPAKPAAPAASTTGPELVGTSVDRRELGGWPARTFNEATGELVETRMYAPPRTRGGASQSSTAMRRRGSPPRVR